MFSSKLLKEQFKRLDSLTRKFSFRKEEEVEATEQDAIDDGLRSLCSHPEVSQSLVPMYEERIKQLELAIPGALESHAMLSHLEGRKAEAQLYLTMFKKFLEGE